jgi:hypothetical protein
MIIWKNRMGAEHVAQRQWVSKKLAAAFFARADSQGEIHPQPERLQAAGDAGEVQTRDSGKKMTYNLWDCMQACRVL